MKTTFFTTYIHIFTTYIHISTYSGFVLHGQNVHPGKQDLDQRLWGSWQFLRFWPTLFNALWLIEKKGNVVRELWKCGNKVSSSRRWWLLSTFEGVLFWGMQQSFQIWDICSEQYWHQTLDIGHWHQRTRKLELASFVEALCWGMPTRSCQHFSSTTIQNVTFKKPEFWKYFNITRRNITFANADLNCSVLWPHSKIFSLEECELKELRTNKKVLKLIRMETDEEGGSKV